MTQVLPFYLLNLYSTVSGYDVFQIIPVEVIPVEADRLLLAQVFSSCDIPPGAVSNGIHKKLMDISVTYEETKNELLEWLSSQALQKLLTHKEKKALEDKKREKKKTTRNKRG